MKNILLKYLINFFFFLLAISFFWFKFLRTHSPKNIPFHLELNTLFLLLFSCAILIYSFYLGFFYKKPVIIIELEYLKRIIRECFFIKELFLLYFLQILIKTINTINLFMLLIRYMILLFFLLDVFVFQEIYYSYYTIFLLLPVYVMKFCFFSYKQLLKEKTSFLTDKYQLLWGGITGIVAKPEDCIIAQNEQLIKTNEPFPIIFLLSPQYALELTQKFALKRGQRLNTKPYLNNAENFFKECLQIQRFIHSDYMYKKENKFFFVLIIVIYFFVWLHILFISLHTLEMRHFFQLLEILEDIRTKVDLSFFAEDSIDIKDGELL